VLYVTSTTSPRASFHWSARIGGATFAVVSIASAILLGIAIADLAHRRLSSGLWALVAVLVTRWASTTAISLWSDRASDHIRHDWRNALLTHFTRPTSEHERSRGDLVLAVEQASEEPLLIILATSAVVSFVGLFVLFWAGGWLCFALTLGLLVLGVPLYQRSGRRSEAAAIEFQERRALLEARQLELLNHTVELRALGAVEFGANEIAAISDSEHSIAMRAIRVALGSSLVTEFLSGVSIGLVAMVVGLALLHGRTTLLHALIAVLVTSEIFVHVRRYGSEFHRRENASQSLATLRNVSPSHIGLTTEAILIATDLVTEASDVGHSFRILPGDRVLVTGPSGSGKTTLLQTMIDWRTPVSGTVERNSESVGYVSVDSTLLSGTLRENLGVGAAVSDERMHDCLASLGLVGTRFEALETQLLADGRGFSTGEKVRLVLARALLANVAIVMLDDIAGVLDVNARQLVNAVLDDHPDLAVIEATIDTQLTTPRGRSIVVGS
jgi:ABC-type transport system involved in cytochrome bd biosynthesis fused ATPase/permease subunit